MRVNVNNKQEVLDYFIGRSELIGREYDPMIPTTLIIMYKFKTEAGSSSISSFFAEILNNKDFELENDNSKLTYGRIGNFDIPLTMNLFQWGTVIQHNINNKGNIIHIQKPHSKLIIEILIDGDKHLVKILRYKTILLQFIDISGNNNTTITRELANGNKYSRNSIYSYVNGERTFYLKPIFYTYMEVLKPAKTIQNKFITIDIETQ